LFIFSHSADVRQLDSFPTRRSSDLEDSTLKLEDNSALLDFTYTATDSSLNLTAIQAQTVGNTIASDNKNAGNAAVILQNIIDNRSEEHTSELQSRENLVCRLLLEKK